MAWKAHKRSGILDCLKRNETIFQFSKNWKKNFFKILKTEGQDNFFGVEFHLSVSLGHFIGQFKSVRIM